MLLLLLRCELHCCELLLLVGAERSPVDLLLLLLLLWAEASPRIGRATHCVGAAAPPPPAAAPARCCCSASGGVAAVVLLLLLVQVLLLQLVLVQLLVQLLVLLLVLLASCSSAPPAARRGCCAGVRGRAPAGGVQRVSPSSGASVGAPRAVRRRSPWQLQGCNNGRGHARGGEGGGGGL